MWIHQVPNWYHLVHSHIIPWWRGQSLYNECHRVSSGRGAVLWNVFSNPLRCKSLNPARNKSVRRENWSALRSLHPQRKNVSAQRTHQIQRGYVSLDYSVCSSNVRVLILIKWRHDNKLYSHITDSSHIDDKLEDLKRKKYCLHLPYETFLESCSIFFQNNL